MTSYYRRNLYKMGGVLESIKSEASYTAQKNLCVRYFIRFSEKV
jgi:hypothetical protein